MFPQCLPVSHTEIIVSSVSFQYANYAYATQQGILTKIRACEHLQKVCEHEQASTHQIFASNSIEQRPNFASTFILKGTIRYPSFLQHLENFLTLNKFFPIKLKKKENM